MGRIQPRRKAILDLCLHKRGGRSKDQSTVKTQPASGTCPSTLVLPPPPHPSGLSQARPEERQPEAGLRCEAPTHSPPQFLQAFLHLSPKSPISRDTHRSFLAHLPPSNLNRQRLRRHHHLPSPSAESPPSRVQTVLSLARLPVTPRDERPGEGCDERHSNRTRNYNSRHAPLLRETRNHPRDYQ